jgi:deoxycytidylate deaminase
MSMRMAAKAAKESTFKQHRLGAVIVKGGNILATGFNTRQPSSLLKTATRHAEASAILKLLKKGRQHDLVGSSLFVSRFTSGGRIGLSRPCDHCMGLIRSVGIKEVWYTTDEGTTERLKV